MDQDEFVEAEVDVDEEPTLRQERKRRRRQRMVAVLPTLLTLGNAASGFGSITFAAKIGPELTDGNELLIAAALIFIAMIFDMLDGSAARWARQTSNFGAELDSLCDGVSFGVAPAFLMLQFSREYHPRLLWVIGALFVVCALLRLARFNVETEEDDSHEFFSGLPSPAAAGTVASFPIAMRGLKKLTTPDMHATVVQAAEWLIPAIKMALPIITLTVACLMVSRIRYSHVFNQLLRGRRSRTHVIQLIFTIAVIVTVPELAVPLIFCYFAFASPIRALWTEFVAPKLHKSRQI